MNFKMESDKYTSLSPLYKKLDNLSLKCLACAHKCLIKEGERGICNIRFNKKGALYVPKNYVSSIGFDPIEKKPFFHIMPGALTLSYGMLGCNFKCPFCQNHEISQVSDNFNYASYINKVKASNIIDHAASGNAKIIISTYNEPVITSEWSLEIFKSAAKRNMKCGYVSNGYASKEVLDFLMPHLHFLNVDLKTFNPLNYSRIIGGKLENVLQTITQAHERGIWLEIVTLLIKDFNTGESELNSMAEFIAGISVDIPWHITAFHPCYKMTDTPATDAATIRKAFKIGKEKGLKYIYAGNIQSSEMENTYCPKCGELLVERNYNSIGSFNIKPATEKTGKCPKCQTAIPGIWF
ncbi:MAG: AmmeMemoRadiSam system radical SAM enzyme [Elusimicrobiota bacterium]|nr:AmmeMemoRadiSam system radical SAM enzyme [Elusimicrobiota bacterium]